MRRVYGPDYMLELCRVSVDRGYTHFLYGGKKGVADRLAIMLMPRFPGLQIVGTFTPPFRPLIRKRKRNWSHPVTTLNPTSFGSV